MITLDGQNLFNGQAEIELGSIRRHSIEKAIPGLDGVLTIDLGVRGRKIKQKGLLRAKSILQMNEKISDISAYMDGRTHTLVTGSGGRFDNLRIDDFKVGEFHTGGAGIAAEYEITYMQLAI